jgi:hypothetical protein
MSMSKKREQIYSEYRNKCRVQNIAGRLQAFAYDSKTLIIAMLISSLTLFIDKEVDAITYVIRIVYTAMSLGLLVYYILVRIQIRKHPEWQKDVDENFKKLLSDNFLNQSEELLKSEINYCEKTASDLEFRNTKGFAFIGVLLVGVWNKTIGMLNVKEVKDIVFLVFAAIAVGLFACLVARFIEYCLKAMLNFDVKEYREFAQKLEEVYYELQYKKAAPIKPKTPDFTPFPTHPFKWRYTATKGLELKLKNKAKESLTISFNETELNILFAHILKKQSVDLANEKRKLENGEYTEGIGYFIKDILNKEESIKVTKYLVALLESKRIIETNGNHNKIKISLDTEVFNWQTIF